MVRSRGEEVKEEKLKKQNKCCNESWFSGMGREYGIGWLKIYLAFVLLSSTQEVPYP